MVTRKTTPPKPEKAASRGAAPLPGRPAKEPGSRPSQAVLLGLTPTLTPGIYTNKAGILVDEQGIMVGFAQMKQKETDSAMEVLGRPIATPAEYLTAVALDPRISLPVRMEAAKAAAPYTDRKQPTALDGGLDPVTGAAVPLIPKAVYAGWSEAKIDAFLKLMESDL